MTRRAPWPTGAEQYRKDAIVAIRRAKNAHLQLDATLARLEKLIRATVNEPLAHMMIADIRSARHEAGEQLSDAMYFLALARNGEREDD